MSSWDLLDEREEQELHKIRLLNVEEKPFKRITKRIATITALARERPRQQATPPPDGPNGNDAAAAADPQSHPDISSERSQLKEDVKLDFAAFDSSIARLQFLLDANERERDRYAADQQRILSECAAVRADNARLREKLDAARATLAQRKAFDRMADDITNRAMLRPRDDQRVALRKLEDECAALERETETYTVTWGERRDQFARIMDEAARLRRQIRDEQEEVERREGMNEDGEEDGEVSRAGDGTPRHHLHHHPGSGSRGNTPRPDGEAGTPRPTGTSGGRTPLRESQQTGEGQGEDGPKPRGEGPESQPENNDEGEIEEGEDVEMEESAPRTTRSQARIREGTPRITVAAPQGNDGRMEVDD
ncbi:hypothetical protein SODALDRAFT_345527 [Sodiomyces alkalinus F11]|uniref:Tho complex subunit 7 n=1 Tax=Sodiomyces alkalinus (strain CBS 110278 / VKM F-3762 / F11) TaxID=1314773 RepID=A0A3N2PQY7_SODAK|nr:hypothetical protein SODALDRAFT_345527 [Sodiomyces alkalinus F11]ROT36864.1 hypothetical protein SODALDRAFT_345527 [Sodiomyces alkalinus F11]